MGRKSIQTELKKQKLSVTITEDNYKNFKEFGVKNKSKLINWLLMEHFGLNQEGGSNESK